MKCLLTNVTYTISACFIDRPYESYYLQKKALIYSLIDLKVLLRFLTAHILQQRDVLSYN